MKVLPLKMARSDQDSNTERIAAVESTDPSTPVPRDEETPTSYADRVGEWYAGQVSVSQRRANGFFLTPVQAARYMGAQVSSKGQMVRVLDPAAGAGILGCAAVEAIVARALRPDAIELVAYEVDGNLVAPLCAVLDYLATWCRELHGTAVCVRVKARDFILANADAVRYRGLFPSCTETKGFDTVIANPPYFKISKSSIHAAAVPDVVHGQPNIYSLFMAVGAALLRPAGDLIFITPRSFASGRYFHRFRAVFFDMIRPKGVHLIESRRDTFRRGDVLQENVILCGSRQDRWHGNAADARVRISLSRGLSDIDQAQGRELAASQLLEFGSSEKVLSLPVCDVADRALALVKSWPTNLAGLGLSISTGPVVPFRASACVSKVGRVPSSHVPLLWMNHVQSMRATWPLNRHKPEYIRRTGARSLLVPNRNYILLRRFSAKEEARRLTAAPWIASDHSIPDVGFENHLNYIHRLGGTLSLDEAWGLAALYNSSLLDTWFRTINGNTQVSATELRTMPLPDHETIVTLGQRVRHLADPLAGIEAILTSLVMPSSVQGAAVG